MSSRQGQASSAPVDEAPLAERVRRSNRRAAFVALLVLVVVPIVGIVASTLFPPSASDRAARIEGEIRSLELERSQVAANALKRQIDNAVMMQGADGADDVVRALADAERAARELDRQHVVAIETRLSRLRTDLARLRP